MFSGLARRASRVALVVGVAVAAALCAPSAAFAHNYVVSTTPAEGETLTELPDRFVVTTNDVLLELGGDGGFAMQVTDASGLHYGDGCVIVDGGPSISTPATLGAPGDYTLEWQAVSADGHTISGDIPFSWSPDRVVETSDGSASPRECGVPAEEATSDDTAGQDEEAGGDSETSVALSSDGLWIGATAALLVAVIVVTIVLTRRRTSRQEPTTDDD